MVRGQALSPKVWGHAVKPLIVYSVREENGRKYWTRIGEAWIAKDGTMRVTLQAAPLDGKAEIRPAEKGKIHVTRDD